MPLSAAQQRTRNRVESLIGLAAPFLDLLLAAGDRVSRIAEPEDYEYYPVRAGELGRQIPAQGADSGDRGATPGGER